MEGLAPRFEPRGDRLLGSAESLHHTTVGGLPRELWVEIFRHLHRPYDGLAFGLACRTFLQVVVEEEEASAAVLEGRRRPRLRRRPLLSTKLTKGRLFEQAPCFSLGWYRWVLQSFKRKVGRPGRWRYGEPQDHFYDYDLVLVASIQGSLEALTWLVGQGISLDTNDRRCRRGVAGGGHVEMAEYLKRSGESPQAGLPSFCSAAAASAGHVEVLKWLKSKGYEFDASTSAWSVYGGHLHVLKWLRSQDPPCDWDEFTCSWAALGGDLTILQWARGQDPPCPWNIQKCLELARSNSHWHIWEWIASGTAE
ncbi:hypothetical protein HOP50_12g66090 [Chloropicon primus]|uniref:F-box domain-containing protein n=1 Tax=Chloropicon primus TaxID=1764295 RepID=A0A5B8MWW7_9CHLO|nr:hypothetical protein A3770_12p65900 [Chloropicon primus]UPR03280.1 hypothetical protein HOP50_12g66090 [Chloropicon primus]|mmetsp:Transcript_12542/g.34965  ORF Transcript_12542/g.34965 Transcript_12542/m.34965 type:complete len:309 (-) Transcript_12542:93-1019(-)|eukprot:QDZ24072.1 hypothetical protein A3770_12p65900 [Chloropicon primus]